MRNILIGAAITLAVVLGINFFINNQNEEEKILEGTALIEQQIRNVGKLIVTEGNFSQVFTFENNKKFYLDIFSARKKAIVIVNADVTVAYDLRKIETEIDEENRTLRITHIPDAEIKIHPSIEYYDVTQDYLNKFDAEDYNKIKKEVINSIEEKIAKSKIKSNAENRLISELQRFYILTNSLGWTLEYNGNVIKSEAALERIKL